jgi:hypothetical protein
MFGLLFAGGIRAQQCGLRIRAAPRPLAVGEQRRHRRRVYPRVLPQIEAREVEAEGAHRHSRRRTANQPACRPPLWARLSSTRRTSRSNSAASG